MQPSIIQAATPLLFGWEHVSLSVSIADGPQDEWLDEPITGVLLQTDRGPVLLDTGPSLINIEKEKSRSHGKGLAGTVQIATDSPEDPLVATLHKYARLTPQDIAAVVLSHLHFDHAGGLHHFANRNIPIFVQQPEFDFAFSPDATAELGYFPDDYRNLSLQWHKIYGDHEVLPGLQYLFSPGHTPGNSSFLITLKSGEKILFAFDTADLQRNLDEEIGVGFSVGIPAKETALPIKRIKQIAQQQNAKLYPGHCPTSWPPLLKPL